MGFLLATLALLALGHQVESTLPAPLATENRRENQAETLYERSASAIHRASAKKMDRTPASSGARPLEIERVDEREALEMGASGLTEGGSEP